MSDLTSDPYVIPPTFTVVRIRSRCGCDSASPHPSVTEAVETLETIEPTLPHHVVYLSDAPLSVVCRAHKCCPDLTPERASALCERASALCERGIHHCPDTAHDRHYLDAVYRERDWMDRALRD